MKKISFLTQNEGPFRMKWLDELAKYFEITVFHVGEYDPNINMKFIGVPVERLRIVDVSKVYFGKRLYDYHKIFSEPYDLLILDGYGFIAQLLMIIHLKRKRIPYAMNIDGGFLDVKEGIIKKNLKKFFMSGARWYFSTSKDTDAFIKKYAGETAVINRHYFSSVQLNDIRDAIDLEEKLSARSELNIKEDYVLIAVGQFIHRKGFDVLIRAMKLVDKRISVYFVGASDISIYSDLITDDIRNQIHFVGFCDTNLLKKYYIASDVFVLPTREDVWGLVIGEAMACGLPVITTNRCLSGMAMITNAVNGYIVEVENEIMLADRIDYLYQHPELTISMAKNNLKLIRQYAIENACKIDRDNIMKEM